MVTHAGDWTTQRRHGRCHRYHALTGYFIITLLGLHNTCATQGCTTSACRFGNNGLLTAQVLYAQGGIDEGEDPRAAVVRELREETGISSASIIAEHPAWLQYDFPPEVHICVFPLMLALAPHACVLAEDLDIACPFLLHFALHAICRCWLCGESKATIEDSARNGAGHSSALLCWLQHVFRCLPMLAMYRGLHCRRRPCISTLCAILAGCFSRPPAVCPSRCGCYAQVPDAV